MKIVFTSTDDFEYSLCKNRNSCCHKQRYSSGPLLQNDSHNVFWGGGVAFVTVKNLLYLCCENGRHQENYHLNQLKGKFVFETSTSFYHETCQSPF